MELVDADLLGDPLREDWYSLVYAEVSPAVTVFGGCALCIKHAISRLQLEL